MTITIRLATDNAAFTDDREAEMYTIVDHWVQRFKANLTLGGSTLRDTNGNTVGYVRVSGR